MKTYTFEKTIDGADVDTEDGGRAKIIQLDGPDNTTLFVRIQSWDDDKAHGDFEAMIGRHVRVTIEYDEQL